MEIEKDFIHNELASYKWRKEELEEELALGYITFEGYVYELSILDYDRKELKKANQKTN